MDANLFLLPKLIVNPGGKLTLNIFEDRYLRLLENSIMNNIPMAVGHASHESFQNSVVVHHEKFPHVYEEVSFGTPQILTQTAQGSKLIVINALGKGRISQSTLTEDGFNRIELEEVQCCNELDSDNVFLYRRLKSLTRERVEDLLKSKREVELLMDNLERPHELVAFYADHLLKPFDTRLKVFRENDVNTKLRILGQHLVA